MDNKITQFSEILKNSRKILLINHVRMDGDAIGSLGAFYLLLKKLGYDVKATNDDKMPEEFRFLVNEDIINCNLCIEKYNPDTIISFDAASIQQLGEKYLNYQQVFENANFIVIDHHITNPGFGDLNIVIPEASSTCEVVYDIIEGLGYTQQIDKQIATLLTTGLLTDTNMYYNSNTSSKTLLIASKLLEKGADFKTPIFNFFKKKTLNKTKLWGEVLRNLKTDLNGKIVWGTISQELFQKTSTTNKDISGLINEFLSNMEGMEVCFILYEMDEGKTKASFRSSEFSVGNFCESFGGGGHKQAAGFVTEEKMADIEEKILKKLKREMK